MYGLLSSHNWAKIVVLLLSTKIPHCAVVLCVTWPLLWHYFWLTDKFKVGEKTLRRLNNRHDGAPAFERGCRRGSGPVGGGLALSVRCFWSPSLSSQSMKLVRLRAILTRQTTIDYPRCSDLSIWEPAQEKQHEDET